MEEQTENVYVVFPGMPVQFSDLHEAEKFATSLAKRDQSDRATIMSVNKFYADHSLTAVNVGVVIKASEKVDNPFIDMQWEEE